MQLGFFTKVTEEGLIQEIALLLPDALINEDLGHAIVRQVTIEATKFNITFEQLPYIFKILMEMPEHWPSVMPDKNALLLGREVLARSGVTPNYSRAVVIPPGTMEDAVDRVLQRMSSWCSGVLMAQMSTAYDVILFKRVGQVPKATQGAIPKDKGYAWLDLMVRRILPKRPRWIPKNSDLVLRLLPRL